MRSNTPSLAPLLVFLVFSLSNVALGCGGAKKSASDDAGPPVSDGVRLPAPADLDPGTLLVKMKLVQYEEQEAFYSCDFEVITVVAMGPRSRPLAAGNRIQAAVTPKLANDQELSQWVAQATEIEGILALNETFAGQEDQAPAWKLVSLH